MFSTDCQQDWSSSGPQHRGTFWVGESRSNCPKGLTLEETKVASEVRLATLSVDSSRDSAESRLAFRRMFRIECSSDRNSCTRNGTYCWEMIIIAREVLKGFFNAALNRDIYLNVSYIRPEVLKTGSICRAGLSFINRTCSLGLALKWCSVIEERLLSLISTCVNWSRWLKACGWILFILFDLTYIWSNAGKPSKSSLAIVLILFCEASRNVNFEAAIMANVDRLFPKQSRLFSVLIALGGWWRVSRSHERAYCKFKSDTQSSFLPEIRRLCTLVPSNRFDGRSSRSFSERSMSTSDCRASKVPGSISSSKLPRRLM